MGFNWPSCPDAICHRHDLAGHQHATADFYPLHWKEAANFLFPEFTDEVMARTAQSSFVHLWGAALRELKFDFRRSRPLRGSYLDLMYGKYLDAEVASALQPLEGGSVQEVGEGLR